MRDGTNADWKGIIEIARTADAKLSTCRKPGQRVRFIYLDSYRKACALGYHGDADEWETFVRVRGGK